MRAVGTQEEGRALSRLGGLAQASAATASAARVLTPEQTEGPFYLGVA